MGYGLLLIFVSIVMIVLGYLQISKPELYFRRKEKWKFNDDSAEPSDRYIDIMRITGLVEIIIGIFLLIMSMNFLTNTKYNNDNNSEILPSGFNKDFLDIDDDGEIDSIIVCG